MVQAIHPPWLFGNRLGIFQCREDEIHTRWVSAGSQGTFLLLCLGGCVSVSLVGGGDLLFFLGDELPGVRVPLQCFPCT